MNSTNPSSSITAAKEALEESVIDYQGLPVGIVAACDAKEEALNYDQCFTRDFAVAALAFLIQGKTEIVRNFLTQMVELQNCRKQMDCFQPGQGLMPASFKVEGEKIIPDFGESAIARVAPVDSCFWWLLILRAYVKATDDWRLVQQPAFQNAIRLILDLYLTARFEMLPTMLVPDGSFTIDRRMGVYGHPLDIQALFYMALRSAEELLPASPDSDPKNVPWSYHNGGSWPFLLWLLAAAAQKTGRTHLATQALDLARERLPNDQWPEYYDSRNGRLIGRQARRFQTWTIAGFLSAESLLENSNHLQLVTHDTPIYEQACHQSDQTSG